MRANRILALGILSLGLTVGLLTGLSASPVVGTLLPLLLGALTAGGGIWVARSDASERRARALGIQMTAFVLGFLPGLWLGVGAKFHAERIWGGEDRRQPAYASLHFNDLRFLAVTIELDSRMENSGLSRHQRERILKELSAAVMARSGPKGISGYDIDAANLVLESKPRSAEPVLSPRVFAVAPRFSMREP